ncbi:acetate kinase [Macrococcus equipercicus]|uniref:Acetate kinase n=2 Tax=Macrococcus equipercicus TaxID=69967 RepID=A0A9Q9F2L3_9STAP|nr:acetate kinase [Macrococcus equipercicus]KAA1038449.1 acetate kinase [Macrococcus equipercicus]UTH14905.1 acetate kinase [Macrococcus equipercicus]
MMKKIMAINAGSSSLKFQLFEMPEEKVVTKGLVERIGMKDSIFTITVNGEKIKQVLDIKDHEQAVNMMLEEMKKHGIINDINDLDGTGHRVVHGGELFPTSALVTDEVEKQIESLSDLAPLHNPANLMGIRAFRKMLPNIPHVAVFDTSFHQTMPEESYLYSLPYQYYKDFGIRKYGFHGTSHKYVSERAAELLERPIEQLRVISCHIGNGASIAAIDGGKSVDTSMGFTPLAGVTMGTRSGNLDPALIPYIMEKTGKTAEEVLDVLNKESGLLGISGTSSDLRDIEQGAQEGDERATLALEVFASRIHKYMGSYATRMHGLDAIIFTAGVGENSDVVRAKVLEGLEFMGVYWDPRLNTGLRGEEAFINYPHSPVKVMVIPTDEEVMIARDVMEFGHLEA